MEAARLRNLRDLIIPAHWQNIPVSQNSPRFYRGYEIRDLTLFVKEFDKNDFRLFWKINDQAVSSYTMSKGVIIYRDLKEYDGRVRVVANMQDNPRNFLTVASYVGQIYQAFTSIVYDYAA